MLDIAFIAISLGGLWKVQRHLSWCGREGVLLGGTSAEVDTKDCFFFELRINALNISRIYAGLHFVGPKNPPNSSQISRKISL